MKLSIILPCYNEEKNIPLILEDFNQFKDKDFELILVNNGSKDNTKEVLEKAECPFLKVVEVKENIGYGYGVFQGLKQGKGEYLALSHADMQYGAKDVFLALEKAEKNKLIKGKRYGRSFKERLLTAFMSVLSSVVLMKRLTDINAEPKVFERSLLNELTNPPFQFEFDLYLLYKAKKKGLQIETVPVHFKKRIHGKSSWSSHFLSRYKIILKMVVYVFKLKICSL